MMSRSQGRFLFTQVSALVVFFVTVGVVVLLLGQAVDLAAWARERPGSASQVLAVVAAVAAVACIGILSMALWSRFLVLMGFLTKEEARGYPYSKRSGRSRDLT
jgi:hypothetical protein